MTDSLPARQRDGGTTRRATNEGGSDRLLSSRSARQSSRSTRHPRGHDARRVGPGCERLQFSRPIRILERWRHRPRRQPSRYPPSPARHHVPSARIRIAPLGLVCCYPPRSAVQTLFAEAKTFPRGTRREATRRLSAGSDLAVARTPSLGCVARIPLRITIRSLTRYRLLPGSFATVPRARSSQ